MPIGTYSDYTPPGSGRVFKVPIGASSSHGPENFTTFADKLEESLASALLNAQTGTTYTFVLSDAGKLVTGTNAAASTYTVPPNSSVAFLYGASGAVLQVVNLGAGLMTIAQGAGVTVSGTNLTLAQYESGVLIKIAINTWVFTKGGGLPKAIVSGTTGSPTIDSATRAGKTIYKWLTPGLSVGSVTIGAGGGTCEVLVVGGGGGHGYNTATDLPGEMIGAGGAGGVLYSTSFYLPEGTHTISVGNVVTKGLPGQFSAIGVAAVAPGGGNGGNTRNAVGGNGGSGGGGGDGTGQGGKGVPGMGNNGGNGGGSPDGGGGGGAGAAGSGPTGGAGQSISITGSAVTYGAGGSVTNTGLTNSPVANSGNGGSYSQSNGSEINGASGCVIIVV